MKLTIVESTKTFDTTDKLLCDDLEDWKYPRKCEELKNGLGASGNLKVGFRGLNEVGNVRTWLLGFLKSVEQKVCSVADRFRWLLRRIFPFLGEFRLCR